MWESVKVSNVFNTLTLKQIFWKTKTFFKKLEYRFLVEVTKIENTSFPFKTALSEANVKTYRMATAKWTYHKEWKAVLEICSEKKTRESVAETFKNKVAVGVHCWYIKDAFAAFS